MFVAVVVVVFAVAVDLVVHRHHRPVRNNPVQKGLLMLQRQPKLL